MSKTLIRSAYALGFAGLLLFWGLALALYWPGSSAWPFLPVALTTYAGLIASFLGGVYWGAALLAGEQRFLFWSVTPALLAWASSFLPFTQEVLALLMLFVLLLLVERLWLGLPRWPWFWHLRLYLTVLVVLALCLALFAPAAA